MRLAWQNPMHALVDTYPIPNPNLYTISCIYNLTPTLTLNLTLTLIINSPFIAYNITSSIARWTDSAILRPNYGTDGDFWVGARGSATRRMAEGVSFSQRFKPDRTEKTPFQQMTTVARLFVLKCHGAVWFWLLWDSCGAVRCGAFFLVF